ncbi:hypothetical protein ACP4OV_026054 [Aristida adscensionis]
MCLESEEAAAFWEVERTFFYHKGKWRELTVHICLEELVGAKGGGK